MPLDHRTVAFFYQHAGASNPDTPELVVSNMSIALNLARAEREAARRGWGVTWEPDDLQVNHVTEFPDAYEAEPDTHEVALLRDRQGNLLGTLGCVDDADDDYRRVVAAELAMEAL